MNKKQIDIRWLSNNIDNIGISLTNELMPQIININSGYSFYEVTPIQTKLFIGDDKCVFFIEMYFQFSDIDKLIHNLNKSLSDPERIISEDVTSSKVLESENIIFDLKFYESEVKNIDLRNLKGILWVTDSIQVNLITVIESREYFKIIVSKIE